MTEAQLAENHAKLEATENLRARIAAVVREDLAAEAAAGFPLLRRFPNSEIASVPGYVSRLTEPDRGRLIDALAHYSTLWWSYDVVLEKKARPILGPYLARSPAYPAGDWYGARPKKRLLKTSVMEMLTEIGYARQTIEGARGTDVVEYRHPDPAFAARLIVDFDPGLIRQMDFWVPRLAPPRARGPLRVAESARIHSNRRRPCLRPFVGWPGREQPRVLGPHYRGQFG